MSEITTLLSALLPHKKTAKVTLVMSEVQIRSSVKRIAARIDADFRDKNPLIVSTLKGSFLFTSDLLKELEIETGLSFIRASSYGKNKSPLKKPKILYSDDSEFTGRHIILVEDIVDRGTTLTTLLRHIKRLRPASINVCSLLVRGAAMKSKVRYCGKVIGKGFAVGYGLDYRECCRGLKNIYAIEGITKE